MNLYAESLPLDCLVETPFLLRTLPSHDQPQKPRLNLSIITPVYNERHLVATSLARVLALKDDLIKVNNAFAVAEEPHEVQDAAVDLVLGKRPRPPSPLWKTS